MEILSFLASVNLRELPDSALNKLAIVSIDIVAIMLFFVVYRSSQFKNAKSRIFAFMVIFMLTWVNFAYLARVFGNYTDISLVLLRIAWIATPLLFYSTYLTSVYVLEKAQQFKQLNRVLLMITLLLSASVLLTDWVIKGLKFSNGILDIVYGDGFFVFLFFVVIIMAFTLYPLIKANRSKSAISFLTGVIIFDLANMIFNIGLPVFAKITNVYYFGDYSTIFLLGFTTYAIIRHELFDVKVIATEIFTLLIWIILFAKLAVFQAPSELPIDLIVFVLIVLFGLLLVRSAHRELKQREQLAFLNKRLEELDAKKNEFLNVASHELRAPMTAIKGYISMTQNGDGGEIPAEAKSLLHEAADENDRMIRLVNNMLNVARIEEGRMVFEPGTVNLVQIVTRVYNEFKFDAEGKHLQYILAPSGPVQDLVEVDVDRIHEVITNLISNAVKYTDNGKIVVRVFNPTNASVKVEVEDTGPGLSKEDQQKLFQKFFRAESYSGKKIGTGLGLYISKLLVEKFGGRIGFVSEEGKGSIFWFELPVKK